MSMNILEAMSMIIWRGLDRDTIEDMEVAITNKVLDSLEIDEY